MTVVLLRRQHPEFYTLSEACILLGMPEEKVTEAVNAGSMPALHKENPRGGKIIIFPQEEFDEWREQLAKSIYFYIETPNRKPRLLRYFSSTMTTSAEQQLHTFLSLLRQQRFFLGPDGIIYPRYFAQTTPLK